MPSFIFNKLIRDKLKDDYTRMGQVATYKKLSDIELLNALKQKIIEEANEIPIAGSKEDITSELADIQQAIDDIAKLAGIADIEIIIAKAKKFEKKGGFSEGVYVETLALKDDDEWVAYYRTYPERFKEILHQDP
jgi:predicted house-cleaning noncanonical NTP pyrophosphatase (MazG superfamily)